MSHLARSFAKTKLSSLPRPGPRPTTTTTTSTLHEDPTDPYSDDSSSSASSLSSTGTIVPSASQPAAPCSSTAAAQTPWTDFFAQELYLSRAAGPAALPPKPAAKFHVYVSPAGGGSSREVAKAPLLVLHHGAGSGAMTFGPFAEAVRKAMGHDKVGILAVECREHGSVVWKSGAEQSADGDLRVENLALDLVDMVQLTAEKLGWEELPSLVLVGHSLGGAVVTHVANKGAFGAKLLGYAVLDVVEGSAMETIAHMQTYLAARPKSFASLDEAIEWHIRSRTLRDPQSARASVPSLLVQTPEGRWRWRTELSSTQPYWENWFTGLSKKFLAGKGAKLLLLAGTDRLDKELMIGQMQGKFQLQVFPAAGHFLHEDLPTKTAEVVVEFVRRNDRSALVLPPKVSDLLAQGKKV